MSETTNRSEKIFLPTGDQEMDGLFSLRHRSDSEKDVNGLTAGIPLDKPGEGLVDTPVIVVQGAAGTGKTTLALQSAFAAAALTTQPFRVLMLSMEQTPHSLRDAAGSFGFDRIEPIVKLADKSVGGDTATGSPFIELYHLSPLAHSGKEAEAAFETRFTELKHILEKVGRETYPSGKPQPIPILYLDSLNALAGRSLERNEIHRLFAFFRSQRVPAVVTLEEHASDSYRGESSAVESARFLADVVIELTKDPGRGYLGMFVEIAKSRIDRQVFGKHLFKIRTANQAGDIELDKRKGLVVYPSIHSVLSRARPDELENVQTYGICSGENSPLHKVLQRTTINTGECIAIVGPPGTHKLALGMNLAGGQVGGETPRMLVVSFGGTGEVKFNGVAWASGRGKWRGLKPPPHLPPRRVKFWQTNYTGTGCQATVLTFRIGELSAEECFYVVDSTIRTAKKAGRPYSAVLLCDTAEICSGFPLLRRDPMFFPALIDLFEHHQLVTVGIGVQSPELTINQEFNFALLARANYRIVLSHYPDLPALSEKFAKFLLTPGDEKTRLTAAGWPFRKWEQLVSLVIDNVTGKHYGREPRWLWVDPQNDACKVLNCSDFSNPSELQFPRIKPS